MKCFLLSLFVAGLAGSAACAAGENYGVLSEARVVRLPEDGAKWYVSVIGKGSRYQEVLSWFESGQLRVLKDKVHFFPVHAESPIYARYAPSIKALPVVRVQTSVGRVVYEAAGEAIPMTAEGLYSAIAASVNGAEELLPWRRQNKKDPPKVDPNPEPSPLDPEPQPIDDGGVPELSDTLDLTPLIGTLAVLTLLVGTAIGRVSASRNYYSSRN